MTARKSSLAPVVDVSLPDDGPTYPTGEEQLAKAGSESPSAPTGSPSPVALIGAHQMRVLMSLFKSHGITTDTSQYDWLTLRLGREMTSRKDITAVEAAHIIRDLDDAPPPAGIYEALAAVMRDVDHVAKGDRNTQQNFSFRGVDAVVNAAGPAFRTHRVIVLPVLRSVEYHPMPLNGGKTATVCRVVVAYQFVASDGSKVEAVVAAEAFDMGDKATPKAMSVAFRTALLQALALPTDEPDPDAQTYEAVYDQQRAHTNAPSNQGENRATSPVDDLTGLDTAALLLIVDEAAQGQSRTFEEFTAKWRHNLGGVDVPHLDNLPAPEVAAYVREVRRHLTGAQT